MRWRRAVSEMLGLYFATFVADFDFGVVKEGLRAVELGCFLVNAPVEYDAVVGLWIQTIPLAPAWIPGRVCNRETTVIKCMHSSNTTVVAVLADECSMRVPIMLYLPISI